MYARPIVSSATAAAFLAFTVALPAQDDFRVPTVGETLGAQAGDILNAIRDGRRAIAELNTTIQQTRQQFWTLYPDGRGLREAEAAYGRALLEKDLYYLQQLVAKQIAAPLVSGDDFDRSIANPIVWSASDGASGFLGHLSPERRRLRI